MTNIRGSLLLTIGLLFCILGCTRDRAHVLMPDHTSPPTEAHETVDPEMSFEQHLLPILTARCALAGCHVADGPHGLDFRTYASFIAGGEHGPEFIPGNAADSEIVKQITSGNMPPGGPPLTDAEIQHFVDWINQQEAHGDIVVHDAGHDAHDDMAGDHDAGAEHDAIDEDHEVVEAHEGMADAHGDEGNAHDDDVGHDEMNGEHDNGDN